MDSTVAISAAVGAAAALLTRLGEHYIERFFDGSTKREARRDADLQVIERVVFEVRDLATAYWVENADQEKGPVVAASIVGRLHFVASLIDEMFEPKTRLLREMHVAINRFDTSCTFGDFDGRSRKAEPGRCREIEIAAYALVHQANKLRRRL